MEEIQENLAEYNKTLNFIVKFKAPSSSDIYKTFIIEEKLHKGLTFNMKNSLIKANGEIIVGEFDYDDNEKKLKIEFDNPAYDYDMNIEIVISTNITNLASIVESNYIVSSMAYIKIKGFENIEGLITKSNIINIRFNSVKIDMDVENITHIIPAISGQEIVLKSYFNTIDTNADYEILIKNELGDNLELEEMKSYITADGRKIEPLEFRREGSAVCISLHNSNELKNKKINVALYASIQNVHNINNELDNKFILYVNNIECSIKTINIHLIKSISCLTNELIHDD